MIRYCLIASLLFTSSLHARTYYISAEGKDTHDGLTESQPLRSLYHINKLAQPGDTFVLSGTFQLGKSFATLSCAGTARNPIRITSSAATRSLIRFEGWNAFHLLPGAAHIEISGLDIEGASASITLNEAKAEAEPKKSARFNGNGVSIDGRSADKDKKERPHHITVRDLRIWACPGGGISAIQSDYITVEDCVVSRCGWYSTFACSGISVWQAWNYDKSDGYHIRIMRNRCFENRQNLPAKAGGKIMDGNGIIIDDTRNTQQGSQLGPYGGRVLVEGNTCFLNGGSGIHAYESDHVDIFGNVVWLNNQSPEYTNGQIFANASSDIHIEANVIGAPTEKAATNDFPHGKTPNQDVVWKNNLILQGQLGKNAREGHVIALPAPAEAPALLK